MADSREFFELLRLHKKRPKLKHHVEFLQTCERKSVVPEGLRIHKNLNIGEISKNVKMRMNEVLKSASQEMRKLTAEEFNRRLRVVCAETATLEDTIKERLGQEAFKECKKNIDKMTVILNQKLKEKRESKLCKANGLVQDSGDEGMRGGETAEDDQFKPTDSQIQDLISRIRAEDNSRRKKNKVCVEDLGDEEPCNINPLPMDSTTLLEEITGDEDDYNTSNANLDIIREELINVVESVEPGIRENVATPNVSINGNIMEETRVVGEQAINQSIGLASNYHQEYYQGSETVVNLSSRVLTEAELSVLSRGLKFCPTPEGIDAYQLRKDITEYARRVRLREYFYNDETVESDFSETPAFKKKSSWCPKKNREMVLEAYVRELENKILSSDLDTRVNRNLTREEQRAFSNLRRYNDIIIKEADKGSGVVIMDREIYIAEGKRQLSDAKVYKKLPRDPTMEMRDLVNKKLEQLHDKGYINDETLDYLLVDSNTKAGRYYLLPKIHKKRVPGRPVISGCGTPTEKISQFVEAHLKPLVPKVKSYIKDTNDFLRKINNLGILPDDSIMVTIDVVGLYPSIPHDEGLRAIKKALDGRRNLEIPSTEIAELAGIVLRNNNFEFDGEHFLQILGTAIGTKMAPPYANLFMDELERTLIDGYEKKPHTWFRYIDDIFMIWTAGEKKLERFLNYINNSHDTIKFTWNYSREQVDFLDVTVLNRNGKLETDLYVKPTDKHQYLDSRSCHPRGCKEGIPYAQALRLRRICSLEEFFDDRARRLTEFLVARGYEKSFVMRQINRAKRITREEALTPRETSRKNERIPFVVTYHPGLPNIGKILRDLHPVLHASERCKKAIKEQPMVAFRRPKSLKDYLVHAKVKQEITIRDSGNKQCASKNCRICRKDKLLKMGDTFESTNTGKSYTINYSLNCNSSNVVYLLSCKTCGKQYVGSTSTKFRLRFNNHRSRLNAHGRMTPEERLDDDILYRHFFSEGHRGLEDISIQLIDRVDRTENLMDKEGQWAYKLKTLRPHGLNESDFFYSQNRGLRAQR